MKQKVLFGTLTIKICSAFCDTVYLYQIQTVTASSQLLTISVWSVVQPGTGTGMGTVTDTPAVRNRAGGGISFAGTADKRLLPCPSQIAKSRGDSRNLEQSSGDARDAYRSASFEAAAAPIPTPPTPGTLIPVMLL